MFYSTQKLTYKRPGDAARLLPIYCLANGAEVFVQDGVKTFEVPMTTLIIEEPWAIPFRIDGRKLNLAIARFEIASLLGETPVDSIQRRWLPMLANFQDDNVQWGNYGARVRGQMDAILDLLREPGSRQAVMHIHDMRDLFAASKDIPCTLTIQFMVRDGKLISHVSMRSNDAWLGLPYDLMQFCALHCTVAQILRVEVGPYFHTAGSMHLYERDAKKINALGDITDEPSEQQRLWTRSNAGYVRAFCQDMASLGYQPPYTDFEKFMRKQEAT